MEKYLVEKTSGTVEVIILPSKEDGKFSFVNLTKGHICSCKFDTIEDAVADMEYLKIKGVIIKYTKI